LNGNEVISEDKDPRNLKKKEVEDLKKECKYMREKKPKKKTQTEKIEVQEDMTQQEKADEQTQLEKEKNWIKQFYFEEAKVPYQEVCNTKLISPLLQKKRQNRMIIEVYRKWRLLMNEKNLFGSLVAQNLRAQSQTKTVGGKSLEPKQKLEFQIDGILRLPETKNQDNEKKE
jgi:hypothetical protein